MPKTDAEYTVVNESRNRTVANRVRLASTGATRRKGLLGVSHLDENSGLWIVPCEAVHTFGMRIPIDTVFLDRKGRVKKIRANLRAWRFAVDLRAHSVLELAAGALARSGTQVGDHLAFKRNAEGETQGL
ncbi:MAG: DUF192 domain-containing protein [Bryobacteraceae bacterium]